MTTVILWVFVIVLGLDLGAGVYEGRIVVPLWAGGVPATLAEGDPFRRVAIDAGIRFWAYMTSAAGILAAVTLVSAFWMEGARRTWSWVGAVGEIVAFAMTLLYFRPTLVRLFMGHGAGLSPEAIRSTVRRWVLWNRIRVVITLVAWCAALRALTLS